MTWKTPKLDWKAGDTPNTDDLNRWDGNIDVLGRLDRTSGYGITTGINAYEVILNPSPLSYYEGMCIAIKVGSTNTNISTLNVNGLGAKSIRKSNGNNISSGNLKVGSIYTLRYNGVNFILQGEGGEGTAITSDVLVGKTFTNDLDTLTGTMPSIGGEIIIPTTSKITIPKGYHDGTGYVNGVVLKKKSGTIYSVRIDVSSEHIIPLDFEPLVYSAGISSLVYNGVSISAHGAQGWGGANSFNLTDRVSKALTIMAVKVANGIKVIVTVTGSPLIYGNYNIPWWAVGL